MSLATITICEVAYAVQFERTEPSLTLTPLTSSGSAIVGRLECCGCDYAIFAFGGPSICTGERVKPGGCNNIFRLKASLTCCPIDGWAGAGWYCVKSGSGGTCVPLDLTDGDKCDTSLTICSGPYVSEDNAKADCPIPDGPSIHCDGTDYTLPGAMLVSFSGDWSWLRSVVLIWNAGINGWDAPGWSFNVPGCASVATSLQLRLEPVGELCVLDVRLTINGHDVLFNSGSGPVAPSSWSPFAWAGSASSTIFGCGATVYAGSAAVRGIT